MARAGKSAYYRALKDAGYSFEKHYRDYTAEQLKRAWEAHAEANGIDPTVQIPEPKSAVPPKADEVAELREQLNEVAAAVSGLAKMFANQPAPAPAMAGGAPPQQQQPSEVKPAMHDLDPNEHAGVTLNTHTDKDVIEIDQYGNKWYQKEVPKPAFPKPRGRRVLRYNDPGTRTEQIKVGEYVETFEVAGDPKNARPSEIKITLPSYQTGIYQPPNMPFRVHTYQGNRGFNMEDVQKFYGGRDLVPDTIKRVYVCTDLCYDITSTIRTIENEYRERVLKTGKGL